MGLNRTNLRGLIKLSDERNSNGTYGEDDVVGVSTNKCLIETKANLQGVNLFAYKVLAPGSFAYVADTSRRGNKIALAYNNTERTYIVSTWYVVFRVADDASNVLLPEYLYLYFNRPEFDRYSRTNSWGSAREYFLFSDMEDVVLDLPSIEIQRKYVAIYEAIRINQHVFESGLDNLKLTCDALIEKIMREVLHEEIGPYIEQDDRRNVEDYGAEAVRGLSITKQLISTKANLDGVNLGNYKVIAPRELAYVPVTSRNGNKISIALNEDDCPYITSAINTVFKVRDGAKEALLPGYLMLFFNRSEFDRYARFNSWGSARETFDWNEMCHVRIPIPDIATQRYVVALYRSWRTRQRVNERLKECLKDICSILVKGSIEEARK